MALWVTSALFRFALGLLIFNSSPSALSFHVTVPLAVEYRADRDGWSLRSAATFGYRKQPNLKYIYIILPLCFGVSSYVLLHASRKTFSNVKVSISAQWTPPLYNASVAPVEVGAA